MPRHNPGEDAGVANAQPLRTDDSQLVVNDTQTLHNFILISSPHPARAGGVVDSFNTLLDEFFDVRIGLQVNLMIEVGPNERIVQLVCQGFCPCNCEAELHAPHKFLKVFFCRQVVGIHAWLNPAAVRFEFDGTSGSGSKKITVESERMDIEANLPVLLVCKRSRKELEVWGVGC